MRAVRLNSGHALFTPALAGIGFYLIVAAVWMPGLAPRLYDDARYVELGMLAFVMFQLCRPAIADALTGAWLSMSVSFRFLVSVLLVGGAVAAVVSRAVNLGLLEIALTAQLIILFGVVACAVREGRVQAETALAVCVSAGAALCGLKFWVIYLLYAFEGKAFPWVAPFLEFANVRFFSQYQAYALFLAVIPMSIANISRGWRLFFFVIAANFWALHWMVGTRAAWLGLFVAVALVAGFLRKGRLTWLRWHAAAILAGAVIYLVFSHFVHALPDTAPIPGVNSIVERGQESIDERIALAQAALHFVQEHPLLGVGPGQFGLQPYPMNAAHPHNVPLQLLAEYGLIAGTAGIWLGALLTIFAIRTLRKQASGATDAIGASLVAALLMGMTDALFSGNLIMPQSQILFCVSAGWIAGRSLPAEIAVDAGAGAFRMHRFAIVSTGLLAVAITTILALEYLPLARDIPIWLPRWNPHFWQYGRFYNW
jgi:O-antigen ligase